ncbi:MAG: hypothetical protein ABJE95_23935 [Byssovorax sp.]
MRNGILTAGVVAAMAAAAYGCGGTDTTTGTTGTGGHSDTTASSTATSTATASATATSGGMTTSTSGTGGAAPIVCTPSDGGVLAIDALVFGDVGMNTTASQKLGFDIDGLVSTAASTDLCQPANGGDKNKTYPDGSNGIDNSFGANVLPLLLSLAPGFSDSVTSNITDGSFTIMLDFVGLTAAADQPSLVTRLYGGGNLGMPPAFDGKDCWPVTPELLKDPADIKSSTVVFGTSSIVGNKWSSGVAGTIQLTVPAGPGTITLNIHKAQVTLDLAADHLSATGGLIGGVLDTDEFVTEVKKAVYGINPVYCAAIGTVETKIRQASDIINDGSQDKTKTCNGISIGFGFTMKPVQLGGVGPKTPPAMGSCQ